MAKQKKDSQQPIDVIISGLGPTGLTLAHMLGSRGHHIVILEREPVFYGNARAVYTDDECMRVFQSVNVAEIMQEKMLQETPVQFTRKDGSVIGQYLPSKRPFAWPVVNFFYQPYMETTLTELLANYPNVKILRGRELIHCQQHSDFVTVTHQATQNFRYADDSDVRKTEAIDPDPQTLSARYLVACDGGRSPVREMLGIKMTGKNFPEPWLVVDLEQKDKSKGLRHIPYFNFVVDPELPVVSCIQPDGYHRFEFMLMDGQTKEYMEKPETVRYFLSKFVNPDDFIVKRKLVYTFNALVANQWRDRRVLLAGDAAHMTPQFMGQGASAGIRDAYNLGWKLSLVLDGKAADSLLDSYQSERRDHAKAMIDTSVMLKDVVSMTNPVGTAVRDLAFKSLMTVPFTKKWIQEGGFKPVPVYTKGQFFGMSRQQRKGVEGTLAPQPIVRCINGRRVLLDELLGNGFSLVGLGVDPKAVISEENRQFLATLNTRYVELYPFGGRPQGTFTVARDCDPEVSEVEDMNDYLVDWFKEAGFQQQAIAIFRPDKFTYALVSVDNAAQAVRHLQNSLN